MRVGSLILTLWWLLCGMALSLAASHYFRNDQVWLGILDILFATLVFKFFLTEARRIDRSEK